MTTRLRHLRPLLIGVVVLLLTAGFAFAAKPATPRGLENASQHAGRTVPVNAEADGTDDGDGTEAPDAPEAPEADDSGDGGDNCATDPTGLSAEELAAMTHGSIVCWAAHQETPDGFDNHGAWVSSWAKKNHGHDDAAQTGDAASAAGRAKGAAHSQGKGPKS